MVSFETEELIIEVEKRPVLYNMAVSEYSDRNQRAKSWQEVGKALYPEWEDFDFREKDEKVREAQKRWRSLKDCFRREISLQNKITSESGRPSKRRKYIYFDQLQFLLPLQQHRRTSSSSLADQEHENKDTDDEPYEEDSVVTEKEEKILTVVEKSSPEKKCNKKIEATTSFEKDVIRLLENKVIPDEKDDDDDRHFLMSLLPSMKKFDEDDKMWVRMEIMSVIINAQNKVKKRKRHS